MRANVPAHTQVATSSALAVDTASNPVTTRSAPAVVVAAPPVNMTLPSFANFLANHPDTSRRMTIGEHAALMERNVANTLPQIPPVTSMR